MITFEGHSESKRQKSPESLFRKPLDFLPTGPCTCVNMCEQQI